MKIDRKKQPRKYLKKVDTATRQKLEEAIEGLKEMRGDIVKIKGTDLYRLKIEHYRIGFTYEAQNAVIMIEAILPRGDFYKYLGR